MLDTIIIGKGPGGMSASIYLKRGNKNVLVIGKDYGALEKADKIENYYGFVSPISGRELIENGIAQGTRLGIPILTQEVTSISKDDVFLVKTNEEEFRSKSVILATGKSRSNLTVEGFEQFKGAGVSFCAICDGFFYRNKKIAVIGNGEYAAEEIEVLSQFTKEITLFTNGTPLMTHKIPDHVTLVTDPLVRLQGGQTVETLHTKESTYEISGVFVAIGTANATDFATKLGVITQNNDIVVDQDFKTNLDGLYAIGDSIGGFLQIAKAVSDGTHASTSVIRFLKNFPSASLSSF